MKIPAVILYNQRSPMRGLGVSDLTDVADLQKAIYNEFSEIEQIIRLSNHPSLVKTKDTDAGAGAGSIIEIPENLDANLKPYILQPSGSNLDGVLASINHKVEAINRLTHVGTLRATAERVQSGIALRTEFELLNARLSEKSANGYRKLGNLVINGVQSLSAIAAQTKEDAARLQTLGAQHLTIVGNLKFDVKPPADALDKGLQLKKQLVKKPVFLAASTRDGEEALILDAIKDLDLLTIIVPRHPQRFDEVAALLNQRGIDFALKTSLYNNTLEANIHEGSSPCVILGDTMGELFTYYAACDFAFIGGSLLNYGGQNLIEAATMGKPILIGEHTFNFAKATEDAVNCGAAMRVKNSAELNEKIVYLLENEDKRLAMEAAALQFSAESTGATARMMALIKPFLNA
jgi:3-deoxy-D-manno-octulosonic-acid transferase